MLTKIDLEAFLEVLSDAIILSNDNSGIEFANSSCANLFGYSKSQMAELHIEDLMVPELREAHPKMVRGFVQASEKSRQMMARSTMPCLKQNGELFKAQISIASILLDGQQYGVATIQDFTKIHHRIDTLDACSNTDPLTLLYNRRFLDSVIKLKSRFLKKAKKVGVLYLDLNKFKPLNDTYGHECGDIVLKTIAHRLKNILRHDDYAFRAGGDEFILFLDLNNIETPKLIVEQVAMKVYAKILEPIEFNDTSVEVETSIGVSIFPDDANDIEQAIQLADQAMYVSKNTGTNFSFSK